MLSLRVATADPQIAVITRATDVLRSGGIVAYPTDTLYGLAVDPRSDAAVARLYAAKGRDYAAAIPLIASSVDQARLAGDLDSRTLALANAFWPGPLTLVVRASPAIARRALAGRTTVAVRVPDHSVARALAAELDFCITSSSANRSGRAPAVTPADVVEAAIPGLDLLLDAGACPGGPPSTIVEMADDGPRLIRAGAIAWERVLESIE